MARKATAAELLAVSDALACGERVTQKRLEQACLLVALREVEIEPSDLVDFREEGR